MSEREEYAALLSGEMAPEEWVRRLRERIAASACAIGAREPSVPFQPTSTEVHSSLPVRSSLARMSDDMSDPRWAKGYEKGWNDGRIDGHYDIIEMLQAEIGEAPERMYALAESIIKNMGPENDPRLKGRRG